MTAQHEAVEAAERELDLYDEIEGDLPSLFGRASIEGHEVGQVLAKQIQDKMRRARAELARPQEVAAPCEHLFVLFGTEQPRRRCNWCNVLEGDEASRAPVALGAVPVYLVLTGEIHEGEETYTRHDVCPPMCDAEKLYTHPATEQGRAVDVGGGEMSAGHSAQFEKTYCSQCGGEFGPGNAGLSHCEQHASKGLSDQYLSGKITWREYREKFEDSQIPRTAVTTDLPATLSPSALADARKFGENMPELSIEQGEPS